MFESYSAKLLVHCEAGGRFVLTSGLFFKIKCIHMYEILSENGFQVIEIIYFVLHHKNRTFWQSDDSIEFILIERLIKVSILVQNINV